MAITTEFYIYFITILIVVLLVAKTWLFYSSTSNRNWVKWFFFNTYALYNSRSEKSRKQKILQNRLTWYVLILLLIDIILLLLPGNK